MKTHHNDHIDTPHDESSKTGCTKIILILVYCLLVLLLVGIAMTTFILLVIQRSRDGKSIADYLRPKDESGMQCFQFPKLGATLLFSHLSEEEYDGQGYYRVHLWYDSYKYN